MNSQSSVLIMQLWSIVAYLICIYRHSRKNKLLIQVLIKFCGKHLLLYVEKRKEKSMTEVLR